MTQQQAPSTNVFISYSHQDEQLVFALENYLRLLESSGLIKLWRDTRILPGCEFEKQISTHLSNADIVLFCVSTAFLNSAACKSEIKTVLESRKTRFVDILPVILEPCLWHDVTGETKLCDFLALPNDGKPVSEFLDNRTEAFSQIANGLKKIVERRKSLREIEISFDFQKFLEDSGMFAQNQNQNASLKLSDIYVEPELFSVEITSKETENKIAGFPELIESLRSTNKVLISGISQSGKTSHAKQLFLLLKANGFFPLLVSPQNKQTLGGLFSVVNKEVSKQYVFSEIDKNDFINNIIEDERTVLIVDDFQDINEKSKILKEIGKIRHLVVYNRDTGICDFADDKFSEFSKYELREWKSSKRSELVEKWLKSSGESLDGNSFYRRLDEKTSIVENTLGKILSNGIMPSFPYYILSIITIQDAAVKPLNQEITSQGHCYHWLIMTHLGMAGVKGDDIETYLNLLSNIAYKMFYNDKGATGFSDDENEEFLKAYSYEYNFYLSAEKVFKCLSKANIFKKNNSGFYAFTDKYLYFFFVAKHIAEHFDIMHSVIDLLLQKIHINQNAYILIFISHHTKKPEFIQKVQDFSDKLFPDVAPCVLDNSEVNIFNEKLSFLNESQWPSRNSSIDNNRKRELKVRDRIEMIRQRIPDIDDDEQSDSTLKIRQYFRIAETLGRIIKNRAGSFTQEEIKKIIHSEINLHAKSLHVFFELISDKRTEDENVLLIDNIIRNSYHANNSLDKLNDEKYNELARRIFWNWNFIIICKLIGSCAYSIGSKKLKEIVDSVCVETQKPFYTLVNHIIHLWIFKQVDSKAIAKTYKSMSEFNQRILRLSVTHYAHLHRLEHADRQRLEQSFGLESNKLLMLPQRK